MYTIEDLKYLKEDAHTEFKSATREFNFAGDKHSDPAKRRRCLLGYVVALANEKGGTLVLGMDDKYPHAVVGTEFYRGDTHKLTDLIYHRLQIRVEIYELYQDKKRVLVLEVPSRPMGKYLEFEGAGLMRTGESLRHMDQDTIYQILSEREPDFSENICEQLTLQDLDDNALGVMRQRYAEKQKSPSCLSLDTTQFLKDLKLMNAARTLTYGALILLGKQEVLKRLLPQARIIWEYRNTEAQTWYDDRREVEGPLFMSIDQVWDLVNNRNGNVPHRDKNFITNIKLFNEEVIREAILNAVTHRDYTFKGEVVIKQYADKIEINNPGGFPAGVSQENLVTVSSTPRSRLMAEVLEKAGFVERSGQGVDKIFSYTLQEGKPEPDYTRSNHYQVTLVLHGQIEDYAFNRFITGFQQTHHLSERLSVQQILTLKWISKGLYAKANAGDLMALESKHLIMRTTNTNRYSLSEAYNQQSIASQRIGNRYIVQEVLLLLRALNGRSARIGELEVALEESLNRNQIKYLIQKLYEDGIVMAQGSGKGMRYYLRPTESADGLTTEDWYIELLKHKQKARDLAVIS